MSSASVLPAQVEELLEAPAVQQSPQPRAEAQLGGTASSAGARLTREEVAKHKTADSCWVILESKVPAMIRYLKELTCSLS